MKEDLLLFLYKVKMMHETLPQGPAKRLRFLAELQQLIRDDPAFIQKVITNDKTHFHLNDIFALCATKADFTQAQTKDVIWNVALFEI